MRRDRITEPSDLPGKVVGTPEFQLTACVWVRGILADHHGVPVESVRYRTAGLETPNRPEKLKLNLPPEIDIAPLDQGMSLSDALARGEIDAIQAPREPSSLLRGEPDVGRLWPDFRPVEEAYLAETRIFPIMHVIVLRRELHQRHPWLAGSLQKAFARSRDLAIRRAAGRRGADDLAALAARPRSCGRGSRSATTGRPTPCRPTATCSTPSWRYHHDQALLAPARDA